MEASGALGHAASHVREAMKNLVDWLRRLVPGDQVYQDRITADVVPWVHRMVTTPINDVTRLSSSLYARSVCNVRAGVVEAADEAVRPFLRRAPPSEGFFFGNPTDALATSMNFAYLKNSTKSSSSSSRRGSARYPAKKSTRSHTAPDPSAPSTSSSYKKDSGNYKGRSSRGGGRGRGGKKH